MAKLDIWGQVKDFVKEFFRNDSPDAVEPEPSFTDDPVTSASSITENNNHAGQEAVNDANKVNQQTFDDAYNKYLQSLDRLNTMNISSAEKIMQLNEDAQIKAYNRNLAYLDEYYPRLVASMKKAGINPILAASRGFSSPSNVSSASSVSAPYISSPSQLSGFSSQVANLDFATMREILKQSLGDETDLTEAEINAFVDILSSVIGIFGKSKK